MEQAFTNNRNEDEAELFSVVIPCYNHAKFLEETIDSVLNSVYPNIEIIIVDDGSKDESKKVAESLVAKYSNISYVYQQNQGPSLARNNGISKANGIYILPLDADDLISKDYISEAVAVLKRDAAVKLVYAEAEKFMEKTGPWKLKPFSLYNLARNNMIYVSGVYRKADWVAVGGYSDDMIWGREDWEFWIKLLKNGGKVVKLPFVGFYYRIQSTSRRKTMNDEKKKNINAYINEKHKDFIYDQLKGPLRFQRTYSKYYNQFMRLIGKLK